VSSIAVGAVSILVFGAFMAYSALGLQTLAVQRSGHLAVFRAGYFSFGAGDPGRYSIYDYPQLLQLIRRDPVLAPMVAVTTPEMVVSGLAENAQGHASKTFFGSGFIPSDRDRMAAWDEYKTNGAGPRSGLSDADPAAGIIGVGLARILGMCAGAAGDACQSPAQPAGAPAADEPSDLQALSAAAAHEDGAAPAAVGASLSLLGATTGGAPNVANLRVVRSQAQGVKDVDDSFVGMTLPLAQELTYGRGPQGVTSLVIQLRRSDDMARARARLEALFKARNLPLEVKDFAERTPMYGQVLAFYGEFFSFIAMVMALLVLFTVVNTMTMSVMERTAEIGALRALGMRRGAVRRQFHLEGAVLGALGATLGLAVSALVVVAVNHGGISWTPPSNAQPVPLRLYMFGNPALMAATWLALVVLATLAAAMPAARASRLPVVDALRHV
jgi:putative ABC transport system permease protein